MCVVFVLYNVYICSICLTGAVNIYYNYIVYIVAIVPLSATLPVWLIKPFSVCACIYTKKIVPLCVDLIWEKSVCCQLIL